MLLLIFAIAAGLLAFFGLRAVAAPLALVLLAVFVWQRIAGPLHPSTQSSSDVSPVPEFVSPYPIPAAEREVCKALEQANAEFTPLEAQWHEADDSDHSNEVRRKLVIDAAHKRIDDLFASRNAKVLAVISTQQPQATSWVARLTKIESIDKDYGRGTKTYIVLKGDLPCSVATTFTSADIEGTPEILAAMAKLNVGDYIVISGRFVPHDEAAQGTAAAIEWGGILWGPFGGLWPAAFRSPAFQFEIEAAHRG